MNWQEDLEIKMRQFYQKYHMYIKDDKSKESIELGNIFYRIWKTFEGFKLSDRFDVPRLINILACKYNPSIIEEEKLLEEWL